MSALWKLIVALTSAVVLIIALVFAWNMFLPQVSYPMMSNAYGYGRHMPMMYGGGMMGSGMMFIVWPILLGLLVVIPLAIIWLIKSLTTPKQPLS